MVFKKYYERRKLLEATWQDLEANPPPSEEEIGKGKTDTYHDEREVYRANQKRLFRKLFKAIDNVAENYIKLRSDNQYHISRYNVHTLKGMEEVFSLYRELDEWQKKKIFRSDATRFWR